jgi:hypothetical protein
VGAEGQTSHGGAENHPARERKGRGNRVSKHRARRFSKGEEENIK